MSGVTSPQLALIADQAWALRLNEPFFRLRVGQQLERLPTRGLEEAERNASAYRAMLTGLAAVDPRALDRRDRVTHAFLSHAAAEGAEWPQSWLEQFPVTPYASYPFFHALQEVFAPFAFRTPADAERYLSLMADYAVTVRTARERLESQAQRGWRIPRPALAGVRTTLGRLRAYAPGVLVPVEERLAALGASSATLRLSAAAVLATEIEPALAALIDAVGADYERDAPEAVGLGHYPGGEAAYRRAIHGQLTVAAEPERLHAQGYDEVARITDEMAALRGRMGWAASEADFHEELRRSPRAHAGSAEEIEATYRRHTGRMEGFIPQYFHRIPKAPYDVARLAPEMEAGMSYGYYQPPSPGETGFYRYNGSDLESRLQLNAAALILHELAPGHHFHLARQAENTELHPIRREAIDLAVFNEGWAEYASSLGLEIGLYDDPYDHYGRLMHERFIGQRMVVDTGLNAFGWSLDRARDYMRAQTIEGETQIATETLRYATDMPAQALTYIYGFRRFWEMRRKAEAAQPGLDLRDFHEAILSEGALPLPVLEANLEAAFPARTLEPRP